jgi:hypothetical protein
MFCNYCRASNPNDAVYCSACGRAITFSAIHGEEVAREEEQPFEIVIPPPEASKVAVTQATVDGYSAQELENLADEELDKIWSAYTDLQIMPSLAVQHELRRRALAPRTAPVGRSDSQTPSVNQPTPTAAEPETSKSPPPPIYSTDWMALLKTLPETHSKATTDASFRVNSNSSTEARTGQAAQAITRNAAPASLIGVFRDGKDLIVTRGSQLPSYCVKCGGPARTVLQKKMYWHSSWLALLILLGLWPYLIIVLVVRTRMDLNLPLCAADREKHRNLRRIAVGILLTAAGLFLSCFYLSESNTVIALSLGLVGVLVAGIVWEVASSLLRSKFIDGEKGVFRGASELFLQKCAPKPPTMKTSA